MVISNQAHLHFENLCLLNASLYLLSLMTGESHSHVLKQSYFGVLMTSESGLDHLYLQSLDPKKVS